MSTNFDAPQVTENQANKEVTINDATGKIDQVLTETVQYDIDNTNARTLTNAEFLAAFFLTIDEDGGTPATADITLTVPNIKRGLFVILNETAFNVDVEISGQAETAPQIAAGEATLLMSDGVNVRVAGGGGGGGAADTPYDFDMQFDTVPTSSEVLRAFIVPRAITLPADMAGSSGQIGVNPTATFDIDVQDDSVSIGTISISTGGVFTFTTAGGTAQNIAAGSLIEFIAPAVVDATADDCIVGIAATAD